MSLMKFAPEIVRLRRVAKAYAAGEFSQIEYRDARRDVIENFQIDQFGQDDTRRRSDIPEPEVASARNEPVARPRWPLRTILLVLFCAVLITANVAFAARIVPVSDRDPNPATSPRFQVSEVRVAGFHPYPGVDEASVKSSIRETLGLVRTRNSTGSHGFTQSELLEVGRYLNAAGVHSEGEEFSVADLRDLVDLIAVQKERRGVSLVELEEIAASVQALYRESGYFLAVAYVPSQKIRDGVVMIEVLPGTLGSIAVSGGDPRFLTERFADVLGQPVTHQLVDERLYEINQLPGFKAQAAFEPGEKVGETRLNLDVIEQRTWTSRAWIDNHGDEATGEERITLAGSWLNPRGAGDVLSVGLLASVNPGNQTFGYLEYATPLNNTDHIRARLTNNDFTSERSVSLEGDTVLFDVVVTRALRRTRSESLAVGFGMRRHDLSWDTGVKQKVTLIDGLLSSHRVWDRQRIAADIRLALAVGRLSDDIFAGQDEKFWRFGFDAMAWTPVNLPMLSGDQKLAVKLIGQMAGSHLPATLRLGLGGARHTRGFSKDTLTVDQGLIVGLDLRIPLKLGELTLFADSAYGEGRSEVDPFWGHVTSVGIGWDADIGRNVVSRMSWAMPISAKGSRGLTDEGPRFYWSLQYEH